MHLVAKGFHVFLAECKHDHRIVISLHDHFDDLIDRALHAENARVQGLGASGEGPQSIGTTQDRYHS